MCRSVFALLFISVATSAPAGIVYFDNEADFLSATAGVDLKLETFDGLPFGSFETVGSVGPTSSGISVALGNPLDWASPQVARPFLTNSGRTLGSGKVIQGTADSASLAFTFSNPTNVFGIDFYDALDNAPNDIVLTTASGSQTVIENLQVPNESRLFVGFFDPFNAYTSVTWSSTSRGDFVLFDDLRYAESNFQTSQVPEPTNIGIWSAFGLFGLVARRRRRKRASS